MFNIFKNHELHLYSTLIKRGWNGPHTLRLCSFCDVYRYKFPYPVLPARVQNAFIFATPPQQGRVLGAAARAVRQQRRSVTARACITHARRLASVFKHYINTSASHKRVWCVSGRMSSKLTALRQAAATAGAGNIF
jgi:hypothetical protein